MKKKLKNKFKKYFTSNYEYFKFIEREDVRIESVTYSKNNKLVVIYYLIK